MSPTTPLRIPLHGLWRSSLSITTAPRFHATRTPVSARAFTTSSLLRLKEDADRSPEQIEAKKQEQLKKQEKGEGHWHEELASQTESHVKADRQDVQDHDQHMEDLQKETAGKAEEGKI